MSLDPYVTRLPDYHHFLLELADGRPCQDPNTFVTQEDLQSYIKALEWWPHDAPELMRCPTLEQLAQVFVFIQGIEPLTFNQNLLVRSEQIVRWLNTQGRYIPNPNETKEERSARLNRERVKRARETAKLDDLIRQESDPVRLAAIDAANAEARRIEEEAETAMRGWDEQCSAAHKRSVELGRMRKEAREYWKGVVKQAKEAAKLAKSA